MRWHDDDRFWATRAQYMFGPERMEKTPGEVDLMLQRLEITAPAKVLDLCCGPGRHSIELSKRGFSVTGVDRTRAYLDQARAAATANSLDIEFVESDMRQFCRENAFDAVINMFTSFGYFEDPADDLRVASNIRTSLKPGGRLLMDLMGKEILARRFTSRDWSQCNGVLMLAERKVEQNWTWMNVHEIYIDGTERWETDMSHRLYGASDLCRLLSDAGFSGSRAFGHLKGDAYDQNASRLVVVATK